MQRTRKILVTIGITVGAVGLGAVASAAVDRTTSDDHDPLSTSTTVSSTTTSAVPTTTTTAPTTTVAPTTTTGPADETEPTSPDTTLPDSDVTEPVDEAPGPDVAPEREEGAGGPPDAALFGQCNAFAGRPQPGDSQAWRRLHERAGGDIDGFCDGILGDRADRRTGSQEGRPGRGGPPPGARGRGPN